MSSYGTKKALCIIIYVLYYLYYTLHDFCERGNARQGTIIVYLKVIINVVPTAKGLTIITLRDSKAH